MNSPYDDTSLDNCYHRSRPTWLEIDQAAITNNVRRLCERTDRACQLMAVVKGNAYGHGDGVSAAPIAQIALAAGATQLAVATVSEGIALRQAGIDAPILVLGYTPTWQAEALYQHRLTATVYDLDIVHALDQVATASAPVPVHVKINTGMNRLGIAPQHALDFFTALQPFTNISIEGIFTHFSTADEADKSFVLAQFDCFQQVLATLTQRRLRPPIAHAANSAATLALPQTHLQMVRPGIALYGLHPDLIHARLPADFRPALAWKAQIAHVLDLAPGDGVGYGREFVASNPMRAAVIPVGYADGFPRTPHNWGDVLIHGRHAPILGRVCMDQTIVDVTEISSDHPVHQGDEVVLIGRQGNAAISADDAATHIGTNNYDIVSRILPRVPRIYVS